MYIDIQLDGSLVIVAIFAIHYLGHLLVHLFLKLLHVATFDVILELGQEDLGLRLGLACPRQNLCLDILLKLAFEILVVL
jgi:hypothetical protein